MPLSVSIESIFQKDLLKGEDPAQGRWNRLLGSAGTVAVLPASLPLLLVSVSSLLLPFSGTRPSNMD